MDSRGAANRALPGVRVLLGLKNQRRLLRRREGVLCGLYKPALHNEIPRSSSLSTVASYKTRLKQCLKVPSEHHSTLAAPLWMAAMALWQKIAATPWIAERQNDKELMQGSSAAAPGPADYRRRSQCPSAAARWSLRQPQRSCASRAPRPPTANPRRPKSDQIAAPSPRRGRDEIAPRAPRQDRDEIAAARATLTRRPPAD